MILLFLLLTACSTTSTRHGLVTAVLDPLADPRMQKPTLSLLVRTPEEHDGRSDVVTIPCYRSSCGDVSVGDYVQFLCLQDETSRTVCGLVDHHVMLRDGFQQRPPDPAPELEGPLQDSTPVKDETGLVEDPPT